MKNSKPMYHGHRFPAEIISHSVWLYPRFCLSFRDVEDLMAERGVVVSYESIRQWCKQCGPDYARKLKKRRGRLGDTWFLDEVFVTIRGKLRIEKIFEANAIQEELDTYNPLIPDGRNLKATAMLEYQDVEERKQQLALLREIEDMVWMQVDGFDRVYAISNEDLERSNEEKTSAVHFMRFELEPAVVLLVLQ